MEFRKSLGITALELATKCGLSSGALSQFESGRTEPHLQTFLKMKSKAQENGILLNKYLFCSEEKKERKEPLLKITSLKELRLHLGLSQEEIAKECEVTLRSYGRYEREDTDMLISTFIKIRDYSRDNGFELVIEKKDSPLVIFANECYKKPSLRLCLQR